MNYNLVGTYRIPQERHYSNGVNCRKARWGDADKTKVSHMTWTSTRPSTPGWWWFKFLGEHNEQVETMMHVMECPFVNSLGTEQQLWCSMGFAHRLDGQWSSEPLVPPSTEAR
jgi:hypothetical protein